MRIEIVSIVEKESGIYIPETINFYPDGTIKSVHTKGFKFKDDTCTFKIIN